MARKVTKMEKKDIEGALNGAGRAVTIITGGFGVSLFMLAISGQWMAAFAMVWGMILTHILAYAYRQFNDIEKRKNDLVKTGQWYED